MTQRLRSMRYGRLVGAAVTLGLLLVACRDNLPQSSLNPAGPQARQIDRLFIPVFWIAVGVFVVVEGLIVFAAIRYRRRKEQDANPVQVHGNTKLEVLWTVIPALILAVISVPTITTIFDLSRAPAGSDPIEVRVVGHQWWWEFQYSKEGIVTGNELYIPVGRQVSLTLEVEEPPQSGTDRNAAPVIHSFWVPRLAGKQDLIPGRKSFMRFEADDPGVYLGQCAEFCGLSHANMKFRVVAQEPAEFEEWVRRQKTPPKAPEEETLEAEGAALFENFGSGSCIACHSVDGTQGGMVGPNLAGFGSRRTLGAGMFPNNRERLARWLDDPRSLKPGAIMPDYGLTEEQIDALVAYLMSLR